MVSIKMQLAGTYAQVQLLKQASSITETGGKDYFTIRNKAVPRKTKPTV